MLDIIEEFFYDIDKKNEIVKNIDLNITKDEALERFLKEVEGYLGDYAKERSIKSSEEILELCREYETFLDNEDIFYYYRAYGNFLAQNNKEAIEDIDFAIKKDDRAFEYYLLRGKVYEKIKDESEAIASFTKALELNPKSVEGLKRLGYVQMALFNIPEALEVFEKAYILEKEDHEIYSGLAGCYFEIGQVDKALEYITKAIVLDGTIANYHYNRAIINRILGNVEKSIKDYKKTIEIEPAYHLAYFYLADLYIQEQEYEKAKERLEQLLIINDSYAQAYIKLSFCYLMDNQIDKALENVNKALELEPENPEFYYKRAAIYKGIEENDKLMEDYSKILEIDSKNPFIYDMIGKEYMDREEYDKAVGYFEKGLKIEESESFYGNLAICNYQLKKFKVAKKYFTKSIKTSSQNLAEDYFLRGKCSYYLKEAKQGRTDFEKALKISNGDSSGALYYLAYIEYSEGDFEKCVDYINRYLEVEEKDFMMIRMLSASYSELEKYKEAREVLLEALEFGENVGEIYNDIGLSYYNEDEYDEAIEYFNMAIEENRELAIAYSNRALAKEAIKDYKEAIKDYKEALALSDDVNYYFGIAICYQKLGEKKKALDTYNKLLKEKGENIIILGEIAWNYHKDKEYDKALEFYDRALKQEENKLILAKKVKVLFDMNMLEKGIQLSEKVIDNLDESMQEVKYDLITNVALAYLKVKEVDKAVKSLELCLDYEPIRKKTLEKLIEIFKLEKNKEMVNKYRKLLSDN